MNTGGYLATHEAAGSIFKPVLLYFWLDNLQKVKHFKIKNAMSLNSG